MDEMPSFQLYYGEAPAAYPSFDYPSQGLFASGAPSSSQESKVLSMMKKMGYEEGKGLGKDLQGPVTLGKWNKFS